MDEDQFRSIYNEVNPQRCVFEKALNNRRCTCHLQRRFLLATREGVGCQNMAQLQHCSTFLTALRESARFALKVPFVDGPLPHNKELKVQAGGCHALQQLLIPQDQQQTEPDIAQLVQHGLQQYTTISAFPYGELAKGVLRYETRRKRT